MDLIHKNLNAVTKGMLEKAGVKGSKKTPTFFAQNVSILVVSKIVPCKKFFRVHLLHRTKEVSICLIVKDVDKKDFNKSGDAWKLRWKSDALKVDSALSSIPCPTFLPLRELKLSYQPFAAKERLSATFDVFLADRRIVHHLPGNLGKAFYGRNRGKIPIPIRLTNCNIVEAVNTEVNYAIFQVRGNGTSDSLPVGNMELPMEHLKENILSACESICSEWPGGGLDNIRSIYIQCPSGNLPIYFDATEAPISIIPSSSPNLASRNLSIPGTILTQVLTGSTVRSSKRLTRELIAQVAEDLPVPRGGFDAIMKRRKIHKPKRLPTVRAARKTKSLK
ncbi:hypothetical protein P879_11545 [Paragonimus westermani]|uniref:Ribosome biogenesis protein UTP30 n=1 Tax=Paragonimus westermani TaxID=34504 RepID=A0A8T0D7R9_9TREM|nr:hypothetical protein P879_11545 [Paragonimus westermani]